MRRWLLVVTLTALALGTIAKAGNAQQTHHRAVVQICKQNAQTAYSVKALIQCAAPKLGVSLSRALYVAHRESRYDPNVGCNSSYHCGVYQIYPPLWSHMRKYVYGHSLYLSRNNGRANVILTLRLVKHEGWWPWGY